MKLVEHVACMGERVNTKRWLEDLKGCRWENNITMDRKKEMGWEGSFCSTAVPCEHCNES
jgi:hypothetical protein